MKEILFKIGVFRRHMPESNLEYRINYCLFMVMFAKNLDTLSNMAPL
jgi:hypothetical protein